MTLGVSDLQSDSNLDSIRNSCDVFIDAFPNSGKNCDSGEYCEFFILVNLVTMVFLVNLILENLVILVNIVNLVNIVILVILVREAPPKKKRVYLGIAQIAI